MNHLALVPEVETPDLHSVSALELRRLLATARYRAADERRTPEERETYAALAGLYRCELQLRSSQTAERLRTSHEELRRVVSGAPPQA